MAVNNLIKLRRGTDWSSNPTLAEGEPGFDITNNVLKIGDGTTAWNSLSEIGSFAEIYDGDNIGPIVLECKNETGGALSAGIPVYVSGYYSANGKASIAAADSSSSSTMAAIGILENTINNGNEGYVHCFGLATGFNTSSFSVGDTVYVASGGGLTKTRPTASNILVQNIGRVLRSDANQGRILVLGPGRTNDTPNSGNFNVLTVTNSLTAGSLVKSGGTSSQFLKADGSVDSSTYLTTISSLNDISASVIITESEGIDNNDNDTTIPTSAAVKDYVDNNAGGGGISNIVEDTTPQLGGTLDLNGNNIEGYAFKTSPTGTIVGASGWIYQSGQQVLSNGSFGTHIGDAQFTQNILRAQTTDATLTNLTIGTQSGILLASNRTYNFTVNIIGRRTNGQDNAGYKLEGLLVNDYYGTSLLGTPVKTTYYESDTNWDVQVSVTGAGSGGTDYLLVQCKGVASQDINWVAHTNMLEVGGSVNGSYEANILGGVSSDIIP